MGFIPSIWLFWGFRGSLGLGLVTCGVRKFTLEVEINPTSSSPKTVRPCVCLSFKALVGVLSSDSSSFFLFADSAEFQIGGIHVFVNEGDITEQDTKAIVAGSNSGLDLDKCKL